MQSVRIGVAGVGRLGALHARLYREVRQTELVGVYDQDHQRAASIVEETGSAAYDSLAGLLSDVDALSVVVPTLHHFEVAHQALAAGKHVFIEKPITNNLDEANRLIAMARERGLVLQVGHIERFNAAIRALANLNLAPMFIESHRMASFDPRGTDVAVVLDLMIHDIDIILSLVDSPIVRIDASGVAVISQEPDLANARLQFGNGCVANVTASRISLRKMRKMRLFQRDAYISVDFLQGLSEVFRLDHGGAPQRSTTSRFSLGKTAGSEQERFILYDRLETSEGNALRMELESFVNAIVTGTPPPVTGEDGRRALEIATTITDIIKRQVVSRL